MRRIDLVDTANRTAAIDVKKLNLKNARLRLHLRGRRASEEMCWLEDQLAQGDEMAEVGRGQPGVRAFS